MKIRSVRLVQVNRVVDIGPSLLHRTRHRSSTKQKPLQGLLNCRRNITKMQEDCANTTSQLIIQTSRSNFNFPIFFNLPHRWPKETNIMQLHGRNVLFSNRGTVPSKVRGFSTTILSLERVQSLTQAIGTTKNEFMHMDKTCLP